MRYSGVFLLYEIKNLNIYIVLQYTDFIPYINKDEPISSEYISLKTSVRTIVS